VPNDNFHCQNAFEKAKPNLTYLTVKMPVGCEYSPVNDVRVLQPRHAFFGNSKQLQRHDSVYLSSYYTDYRFSTCLCYILYSLASFVLFRAFKMKKSWLIQS